MAIVNFVWKAFKVILELVIKTILMATFFGIMMASSLYVSVNGPEWHKQWVKNKVESQTYFLASETGTGTGFVVKAPSGKTYILTNKHVCYGKTWMYAIDNNNQRFIAEVVKVSSNFTDLCTLENRTPSTGLPLSKVPVSMGDSVSVMGHPMNERIVCQDGEVYDNISQNWFFLNKEQTESIHLFKALRTNIPILPGNSGSPVVNRLGNVVGIMSGMNHNLHDWGFATPLEDIQDFLKDQ